MQSKPFLGSFFVIAILVSVGVSGCASRAVQTEAILAQARTQDQAQTLPPRSEVQGVPFFEQKTGYCGPATLAMVLSWAGPDPVSIDEIAPQVYTPGAKGSFQSDLISASRRRGFTAIPVEGMQALLKEIAAGHPVIVFENLAFSWLPQWHYAVAVGYDLPEQKIIMHSGPEAFKRWDLSRFERSWMLGNYWGLVILPAGQLAATGSELDHLRAVTGLEQTGHEEEAEKAYKAILKKWPESLVAEIGLANLAFEHGETTKAIEHLQAATKAHPQSAVAWRNLTLALAAAHQDKPARQSAEQALEWVEPAQKNQYREDLTGWLPE